MKTKRGNKDHEETKKNGPNKTQCNISDLLVTQMPVLAHVDDEDGDGDDDNDNDDLNTRNSDLDRRAMKLVGHFEDTH